MSLNVRIEGEKELRAAIRRHPDEFRRRAGKMMVRLSASYRKRIMRDPWRVGETGGGVPVDTGTLRGAHSYLPEPTKLTISVRDQIAQSYGLAVHAGRPWLDYAHDQEEANRERMFTDFLEDIRDNLAQ
jgi:hypothetical protein